MRWLLVGLAVTDPLAQPVRRRLMDAIMRRPGLPATKLGDEIGEAWGTVQYHLGLLQDSQMVRAVEAGRGRLFFAQGMDAQKARLITILHQGRRKEIAHFIREHPGVRQVDLCQAVAVSRKTLRASVSALVDAGLIVEQKGLRDNRYFPEQTLDQLLSDRGPESGFETS